MSLDSFLSPRKTTIRHAMPSNVISIDAVSDDIPVWIAIVKESGLNGELRLKAGTAVIINGQLTLKQNSK